MIQHLALEAVIRIPDNARAEQEQTRIMTISRQFQPDSLPMDELVAALYELLLDAPSECQASQDLALEASPESTCFSTRTE